MDRRQFGLTALAAGGLLGTNPRAAFGSRLRLARERAGLSVEYMAETVSCLDETNDHEKNGPVFIEGVELSEYLSWEAGQAEPSRAHLAHAADLCGVSVEMLVDGSDPEYVDFGRRYREAREAAGLSVAEVADGVGVHLGSPWKMIYREISVFGR